MVRSAVDLQLVQHLAPEHVLRQHPLHGARDRRLGVTLHQFTVAVAPDRARVAAVPVVHLLVGLVARQLDLAGVDHDDDVTGMYVGLCLPRSPVAILEASRPSGWCSASTTYHLRVA